MARGSAAGESIVSQAATEEYRSEHERIFGARKAQRGRWVWDEAQQKLVSADEYQPPIVAKDAPVMVDRFMEGAQATDGTDIGSRKKRREYMAREGVADKSDFSPGFGERLRARKAAELTKSTRETVARAVYERWKP